MWRQVTDEVSWVLTEDDSAWRRVARLRSVICCPELPPGIFLFVIMLKILKSWLREWTEGRQPSQPEHHTCTPRDGAQTQVQMQIFSFLCCDVEPTSGDRRVWKDPSCEVGLCSPSNVASWPGLSPDRWAAEQVWSWNAGKLHKRLLFCNAGPAWGHREQNAFLTNCFTEVLNWRPATIQYT